MRNGLLTQSFDYRARTIRCEVGMIYQLIQKDLLNTQ